MIEEHKKTWMQEVQVQEFHLYESILLREGPVYKVIESFEF